MIIESKHEDSSVTKINKSLVTLYSYKAILRYNRNNASVRLISRLLELHVQHRPDLVVTLTSGLTISLQVLVRRSHCKVCERITGVYSCC